MTNYIATGVGLVDISSDVDAAIAKAESDALDARQAASRKREAESDAAFAALDIKQGGLPSTFSASECLTNMSACLKAKAEEIKKERQRKAKRKKLMIWGGGALAVGFLVLRKNK
jgi:hypothetical protein